MLGLAYACAVDIGRPSRLSSAWCVCVCVCVRARARLRPCVHLFMHASIHLCKYPSVYEHGADGDRQFLSFEHVSLLNAVGLLPFLFIFFYFFISISGGVTSFYFSIFLFFILFFSVS